MANEKARFWAKVRKSDSCWEWTASTRSGVGYGQMSVNGRSELMHRFSWALHRGPIPPGMYVLHRCDNRRCVNPDHLFLGTHLDNIRDMVAKRRHVVPHTAPRGELSVLARLTAADVRGIRWHHQDGQSYKALAAMYGVTPSNIQAIVKRRSWKHVP